jgi:hypothetical protein
MEGLTRRGRRFSELVAEAFRTTALMLEGAEFVAAAVGLTSTKWQILALVAAAPWAAAVRACSRPLTPCGETASSTTHPIRIIVAPGW